MVTLDFLEKVEVFKDLNDEQLTVIKGYCETEDFKRGEKIFTAGEDPLNLWVVLTGQVDLHWELPGRSVSAEKTLPPWRKGRLSVGQV